jgi:carnitine O-acetyltransferase
MEGQILRAELDRIYPSDPEILKWMSYWEKWYLSQRCSLPVYSNPLYLLDPRGEEMGVERAELAARVVQTVLEFYKDVRAGVLEQDLWKGQPLSMDQYEDIFGMTRIPGKEMDKNIRSFSDWITVICNGHIFRQRVLDDNGELFPGEGLVRSFTSIMAAGEEPEPFPLAALTGLPRTEWACLRKRLMQNSSSVKRAVESVEKSLFVLCLDRSGPMSDEALSKEILCGTPGNRWFDKSLQLIVLGNGRIGINFEHSRRDGTPMGRFVRYICDGTKRDSLASGEAPPAEEITPEAGSDLQEAVTDAKKKASSLFGKTCFSLIRFGDFGKDRIKELGVSPDGFLQTSLFLAQKRAWGNVRSVFESVMLRQFRHGRTEGLRPYNDGTKEFLDLMAKKNSSRSECAAALRNALNKHKSRISQCMNGEGIDGILGLLLAIAEGKVGNRPLDRLPSIYQSPAWKILQDIALSTSTTSGEGIESAGYGPAQEDGLAVRYLQRTDHLVLSVTGFSSMEEKRRAFLEQLPGALRDMEHVLS